MRQLHFLLLFLFFCFQHTCIAQPEPFMAELFKEFPNVRDMSISAAGDEMYFTVESLKKEFSAIMMSRKINNKWMPARVASFSGQYRDLEAALSPDGLTLWFASARPVAKDSINPKDVDIWFVKRKTLQDAWSKAVNAGQLVNTTRDEFYPSVATSGNLYFTRLSDSAKRKEDIFISTKTNGKFNTPVPLPEAINSNYYEYNAFVAPDESFIIFTSYGRRDDIGGSDLYISTKSEDKWNNAVHMGAINSNRIDYCPFVDVRNHILYFTSEQNNVPKFYDKPQDKQSLLNSFNKYANGRGQIYSVRFDLEKYR